MTRTRSDGYSDTTVLHSRGKLLVRTLVLLIVAAFAAELIHSAFGGEITGEAAPDFALKSTAGKNLRLSEYRSEVVAIAFWASWCGDCRSGLATLEELQRQMGADGLQVLSVSFDKEAPAARGVAEDARVSFPVLLDPAGEVGRLYDVGNLPLVVLVDRGGKVRGSYEGGRPAAREALAKDIRTLLRE